MVWATERVWPSRQYREDTFHFIKGVRKKEQTRRAIAKREPHSCCPNQSVLIVNPEPFASKPSFQTQAIIMVRNYSDSVHCSECGKVPTDTVPNADEEKYDKNCDCNGVIEISRSHEAHEKFRKGSKHDIPHVLRESNMPAIPEFPHITGAKGVRKILSDRDTHERRGADGNVAKPREVTVEKQIIEKNRNGQINPCVKMVVEQEVGIGQLKAKAAEEFEFDETDEDAQQGTPDR